MFPEFEERGVTNMEYLRATSDDEMRKIGPALRVVAQIGPYLVVILDGGPATAFGFRLVSTPRTKTRPWGPRFWPDFRPQRHPRES